MLVFYLYMLTGSRSRVVSTAASYSGGLDFKSPTGDQLYWHIFLNLFLIDSSKMMS
jgi:hypothetical protein